MICSFNFYFFSESVRLPARGSLERKYSSLQFSPSLQYAFRYSSLPYTVHSTQYTSVQLQTSLHYTFRYRTLPYSGHNTHYSVHSTQYTFRYSSLPYTVHSTRYSSVQLSPSLQYTFRYSTHSTLYTIFFPTYCTQYTVHNILPYSSTLPSSTHLVTVHYTVLSIQ